MSNEPNSTNEAGDRELDAYNAAFHELGLHWHWDSATYEELLSLATDGAARVRHYVRTHQAHLLSAYDADFLVALIERQALARRGSAGQPQHRRVASRCAERAPARAVELGA
jgi:hypothetical protein